MSETKEILAENSESHPHVTIIIPVTGSSPFLAACLESLLHQTYPSYDIIFILQDQKDSATAVIEKLTRENIYASHVYSGMATTCSQKNFNLLAGIQAAGMRTEILVFCDSGHVARKDWLQRLVAPFIHKERGALVSSGYHQVIPNRSCIKSQGRAICVLALSLIRKIPALGQPWGGATAIRREVFENLLVAESWAHNIVDDVCLARILQKQDIHVVIPENVDLETHLLDVSFTAWVQWLTRQWAYLKFIFPGTWLGAGVFCMCTAAAVLVSFLVCVLGGFLSLPAGVLQGSLVGSVFFLVFSTWLFFKHPSPGSFLFWIPASLLALVMGAYCHFRTWFSTTIDWVGIQYHVGKNGEVKKIMRNRAI